MLQHSSEAVLRVIGGWTKTMSAFWENYIMTQNKTNKPALHTRWFADSLMRPAERFCRSFASRVTTAFQAFTDQKFNRLINQSLSARPGRAEVRVAERKGWSMRGDKHRGQRSEREAFCRGNRTVRPPPGPQGSISARTFTHSIYYVYNIRTDHYVTHCGAMILHSHASVQTWLQATVQFITFCFESLHLLYINEVNKWRWVYIWAN